MDDRISWHQAEKEELVRKAYYDALTGILNRGAAEEEISEIMKRGGAYVIGDINGFKRINDICGHPEGDRYLKFAADTLKNQVRREDVVGRIGGDEFVLFLAGCRSEEDAGRLCGRVAGAFREFHSGQDNAPELGMTFGIALYREGDTYESLYRRADRRLLENKKSLLLGAPAAGKREEKLERIRADLSGQPCRQGASCQSYESFCAICRFLSRRLCRAGGKYSVILFSLKREGGEAPEEDRMIRLGELLQSCLGPGDVYTRCSDCQYLALACDASEEEAGGLARRIRQSFLCGQPHGEVLRFVCCELLAAEVSE